MLLQAENIIKHFGAYGRSLLSKRPGVIHAVDDVSLTVNSSETVGLVGESGCGKTTLARVILGLTPPTSGRVAFDGADILSARGPQWKRLRREMQVVFQDPFSSLNPRMVVEDIISEPLIVHKVGDRAERQERVLELLEIVGLRSEHRRRYPKEFSSGQRQRIGIARALALKPRLVVCDEPVSALDLSIQAQIINLFMRLQRELGVAYLFITHDLGVIRHMSDRVALMYLGKFVEVGDQEEVFERPHHPYTQALLSAIPDPSRAQHAQPGRIILTGEIPSAAAPPHGCRFHPRCPIAQNICAEDEPPLTDVTRYHQAACHFAQPFPVPAPGPRTPVHR